VYFHCNDATIPKAEVKGQCFNITDYVSFVVVVVVVVVAAAAVVAIAAAVVVVKK
jgi:hypothetical protein